MWWASARSTCEVERERAGKRSTASEGAAPRLGARMVTDRAGRVRVRIRVQVGLGFGLVTDRAGQ